MKSSELHAAIAGVMPRVSRALRNGDWLTVFTIIRRLGEEHEVPDPEEFAWQALRGLESAACCPDVISA